MLAQEAWELYKASGNSRKIGSIARELIKKHGLNVPVNNLSERLRYQVNKRAANPALYDHCDKTGVDPLKVSRYWVKDAENGVSMEVKGMEATKEDYEAVKDEVLAAIGDHAPVYKPYERKQSKEKHLLVIDIADLHIGKLSSGLGDDYNMKIAVKRAKDGLMGILDRTSGYDIDKILFIGGNDILHTDGLKRATTAGTPQDTDGNWNDNFSVAKQLYVEVLETLLTIADVHYIHNISNHDVANGYFLSQVMEAWFRNCENITFDIDIKHRKYFKYGKCLIGSTHGDGAKEALLPGLMAHEASKYWANTKYRTFFCHHIHHRVAKDYIGVSIQYVRSASGTDRWHGTHGFTGAPKAIEGFLFHPKYGQVANLCHLF